jgi:hypothetical protein
MVQTDVKAKAAEEGHHPDSEGPNQRSEEALPLGALRKGPPDSDLDQGKERRAPVGN